MRPEPPAAPPESGVTLEDLPPPEDIGASPEPEPQEVESDPTPARRPAGAMPGKKSSVLGAGRPGGSSSVLKGVRAPAESPGAAAPPGRAPRGSSASVAWAAAGFGVAGLALAAFLWGQLGDVRAQVEGLRGILADRPAPAVESAARATGPPAPQPSDQDRVYEIIDRVQHGVLHCRLRGPDGLAGGAGSAFLIDGMGHALTNFHVAEGQGQIEVMSWNREWAQAQVLGVAPMIDAAMLKIDLENCSAAFRDYVRPIPFGDVRAVRAGEQVLVLGSPRGEHRSVTLGIVSNTERYLGPQVMEGGHISGQLTRWIQFDAAANPGNSGGPLVNMRGEVVGIVGLKAVGADVDNMGYAIPIDLVNDMLALLQQVDYEAIYGTIGVAFEAYDISTDPGSGVAEKGVKVQHVFANGPAAGILEEGDVISEINGQVIDTYQEEGMIDVYRVIADMKNGRSLHLKLVRGEEWVEVDVIPVMSDKYPEPVQMPVWGVFARRVTEDELRTRAGACIQVVEPPPKHFERLPEPVREAFRKQWRPYDFQVGDIVVEFDGLPVVNFSAFYDRCQMAGQLGPFAFPKEITVFRGGEGNRVVLRSSLAVISEAAGH